MGVGGKGSQMVPLLSGPLQDKLIDPESVTHIHNVSPSAASVPPCVVGTVRRHRSCFLLPSSFLDAGALRLLLAALRQGRPRLCCGA